MNFGLLHPGEMGAAVGQLLKDAGHRVVWLPAGRSDESLARAASAQLEPIATLEEMIQQCDVVLSICPPHAAISVARQIAAADVAFQGIYLDANAVSPTTAETIASIVRAHGARYVDGGIIGTPPRREEMRLYLSGESAQEIAKQCDKVLLEIVVLDETDSAASALKMAYAAWSKGTSALLLAICAVANHYGIDEALTLEWKRSQPELLARSEDSARKALAKGWRWSSEMEEIAATFSKAGLPEEFGKGAADVYRRVQRNVPTGDSSDLKRVLDDLAK